MENASALVKDKFLYPQCHYRGEFGLNELTFNANLQEFAQRIGYISCLHTAGKLSSSEAYLQIKQLWEKLEYSRKAMEIGTTDQKYV